MLLVLLRMGFVFPECACADDFFTSKIEPLLKKHCYECHSHEKKIKGGLALDSRAGWVKGGDRGPAIIPKNPEASLLILAISHLDKDLRMPPKTRIPPPEVELLREWVKRGAPDPRVSPSSLNTQGTWAVEFQKRLDWWSLKAMAQPTLPVISDPLWAMDGVDRFIRSELDRKGLTPAGRAGPEVLLRRLSFVLTGLPPTPALRKTFLNNWQQDANKAYESVVDSLLASPHFGERFARHWMDVVRYTDTYGYEWDNPAKGSWEYRDYLIRAFNQDVGFDQMLLEQLAGDLIENPRIHPVLGLNESMIGPMFYHLGEHRHGSSLMFNGIHQEMVNNKIDAFSKAFLATTVACARCHDHKLEAVSQKDYYALAAMFMTPRWTSRVIDAPGKNDAAIAKLKSLRNDIKRELAKSWLATVNSSKPWDSILEAGEATPGKIEDPAYPIQKLLAANADLEKTWTTLGADWRAIRQQRLNANKGFGIYKDFQDGKTPQGWVIEGDGFRHGHVDHGTPLIALEGDQVMAGLLARGIHTNALSSKLPGALRAPPQDKIPGKFFSIRLAGGEYSGYLVLEGNSFQNETVKFLKQVEPSWASFQDTALKNGVTQVTVEFSTASLNPNFPPRTGLAAGLPNSDFGYDKRSWLGITGIVTHDQPGAPQDPLDHFISLYDGSAPKSRQEAVQKLGDWLGNAVRRWCRDDLQEGDLAILNFLLRKKILPNQAPVGSPLAQMLKEYRAIEAAIPHSRTANSMDERETSQIGYPLNVRGNVDALGELVTPDFLQMFSGRNDVAKSKGSGRMELARSLLHPEHPLTSRVYVNRVWSWIFGAGIAASPDDFGRLGEKPFHPELLDYLAREFQRQGWSTKKLIRRLVLSESFRQGGATTEAGMELDPSNRLLHHYPIRRLEAEAVRDALLAVSLRLDEKLYGRPINPPRSAQDPAKRLFQGPLDGEGRRSLYLQMSIMEPPKFLVTFNLPDLKIPTGRRDITNVPAQALALMNDPLPGSLAKHWAKSLLKSPAGSVDARVTAMFVQALGREPSSEESGRWANALKDFVENPKGNIMEDEAAWSRLCHAMFNTKEFIHYR